MRGVPSDSIKRNPRLVGEIWAANYLSLLYKRAVENFQVSSNKIYFCK
jgi:hypothetical protein